MRLLILLLVAALTHAWAAQSELVLATGEVIRGEIVSETDEVVVITRQIETKTKSITVKNTYLKAKIAKITRDMPEEVDHAGDYVKKAAAAENTAAAHLALLAWCRERKLVPQAVKQINLVLALAPSSAPALKHAAELGCVEVDGRWMLQSELEASTGETEEVADRKTAARDRTKAIVQANQAKKAHLDAVARLEKAEARLLVLPDAISEAKNEVQAAIGSATYAGYEETAARESAKRNQDELNDAKRQSQEESMKFYRQQLGESERRVLQAQAERKAAQVKQRAAEKQVLALENEKVACTKTVATLSADMERLRVAADDAVIQRDITPAP